jgi:hypothetical protein
MEKVVYLLGAGFSAPLGLPLMSNFRLKSEEMYAENPERYAHFKEVFDTIRHISISKSYYETNVFNIEDILSILEMGEYLEGRPLKETFLKYIADVIEYYTPDLQPHEKALPGNWTEWLWGTDRSWYPYAFFVGSLLNLRFLLAGETFQKGLYQEIMCASNHKPRVRYSIVTLNYDLVPERVCSFINGRYQTEREISFVTELGSGSLYPTFADGRFTASLAKLHGSVDTGVIIPPTWSKGVNRDILPAWRLAYQLLADATQLRIIGYSLPTADAYVKFLLKSAVIQDPHLKKIDVICRDSDGAVKRRYDDFIKFDYYKFVNAGVTDYLNLHMRKYERGKADKPDGFVLNKLEEAHEEFMESH